MESNAWLVPMIAGLCLDICGVVILSHPLLKFNPKIYDYHIERNKELREKFDKENKTYKESIDKPEGEKTLAYGDFVIKELTRLDYNISALQANTSLTKNLQRQDAIIALIIITTGFLLMIVGSVMSAHTTT